MQGLRGNLFFLVGLVEKTNSVKSLMQWKRGHSLQTTPMECQVVVRMGGGKGDAYLLLCLLNSIKREAIISTLHIIYSTGTSARN